MVCLTKHIPTEMLKTLPKAWAQQLGVKPLDPNISLRLKEIWDVVVLRRFGPRAALCSLLI